MQRYFISKEQVNNDIITILGSDVHHIKDVMRMKVQDRVFCCLDGEVTYEVEILSIQKEVKCKIINKIYKSNELNGSITIAHGLVMRSKQEEVIRRITEIGVSCYIPLKMQKCAVKDTSLKDERVSKIVKEASEQSERTNLLKVDKVMSIPELINISKDYDFKIMADANEENNSLKEVLPSTLAGKKVLIVIGPESGYIDKEKEMLIKSGFLSVCFGNRVLRTETAPMFIASIVSYLMGDKDE